MKQKFKILFAVTVLTVALSAFARWSQEDCNAFSVSLDNHYQEHGEDITFRGMLSTYDRNCW